MRTNPNSRNTSRQASNRPTPFAQLALFVALVAALSLSGCVGLTGAGTPAASQKPGSPSGTLAASSTSVSFGSVPLGSSAVQTLTLTNAGTAAVMISQATITGPGFSLMGGTSSISVPAGQSHALQIQFAPQAAGSVTGSISVNSNAVDSTLSVSLDGAAMPVLAITSQPASQSVIAGQTAAFTVAATGGGTLTYQWKKNGAPINGATAASYATPPTTGADNGAQFTAVVGDGTSTATSNAAILTVTAAPVAPTIAQQPASQTVIAGQPANFNVFATGTAALTYQWNKNDTPIGGATAAAYTTGTTAASDNGAQYSVTVTNSIGHVTSNPATLTVNVPPVISMQPANHSVTVGQAATFSVTAIGSGTLSYQWKKNGVAIVAGTSASYSTPVTTASDNGAAFTVTISDVAGSVTSNAATLTVVPAATFLLNASRTSIPFGGVNTGSSSVQGVTFTNTGNSIVTISGVSISGAGFTAGGISSGQMVSPGQTATLSITFAPASAGSMTGSALVTSDAASSPSTISLSGTGTQPVSHSVTLNWTASTSAVSGYNVYRSPTSGGPYAMVNSSLVNSTTYLDSTVQSGQTYFYSATSVDSGGNESTFSTEATATIP